MAAGDNKEPELATVNTAVLSMLYMFFFFTNTVEQNLSVMFVGSVTIWND